MSNSEVLIRAESVSKKFCRRLRRALWYGMKDLTSELLGRSDSHNKLRKDEFWAVKDVSLELRRGECLGLIGRNGAGKSTLLKMLNGLIKPDKGRITMRGRVGALIELGAGFNPILTGRENIYVNAAVLGIPKRQVDQIIDDIIDFAEIHDFVDTPVQNYSSGMRVRLGFAIAAQLRPNILLIDEVLAVGDTAFRRRCINHLQKMLPDIALIFVSHQMRQVEQICDRAIYLESGKIAARGPAFKVTSIYLEDANQRAASYDVMKRASSREGSGEIRFTNVRVFGVESGNNRLSHRGENLIVEADFDCFKPMANIRFRVGIEDLTSGALITAANCQVPKVSRGGKLHCEFPNLTLRPRPYSILLATTDLKVVVDLWNHAAELIVIGGQDEGVQYSITDREIVYLPHNLVVDIDGTQYKHYYPPTQPTMTASGR